MLVLSDGNPAGREYQGDPAIRAARESVDTVRRQGIQIMNIAVDNFRSDEIFGKSNVLRFVDLSRLVDDLRKLLIRVVRGAIEKK
jgi:nitric oxide reductase activation protein